MDDEAAPQAAGIRDLVDWEALAALLQPVTLDAVRGAWPDWHVGQSGEWLWAVKRVPEPGLHPRSLLRALLTARTPIGLAEQLDAQERLRALPADAFVLLDRISKAVA
ncbi:MAG TPA: hypothetical protein VFB06_29470 [Streptosporangiaceae bacterium]|nr:hypothetical protein [Streptosporangiaceae bacterium]